MTLSTGRLMQCRVHDRRSQITSCDTVETGRRRQFLTIANSTMNVNVKLLQNAKSYCPKIYSSLFLVFHADRGLFFVQSLSFHLTDLAVPVPRVSRSKATFLLRKPSRIRLSSHS